ncbi:hypothetical protein C7293_02870 [filamentous cyanobacterium CCT1]|nr:hypothetical protein C7293_02870 [filamentous cyanobacterium CCT1]PSN80118.1 hypothetical protein C8B47_08080 [filamentous cyanobacterium CCP4]
MSYLLKSIKTRIEFLLIIFLLFSGYPILAYAQNPREIIEDEGVFSVGTEVIPGPNNLNYLIYGGESFDENLLHSFSFFSVPINGSATFTNSSGFQNIFSRVTGGSASNINGLLRVEGSANLFLINPSGIIFGPSANFDIGGSFFASTASNIEFENGVFSAIDPQAPRLSIGVPVGLQFGATLATIEYNSLALILASSTSETFALVGGDILIDSGGIAIGEISGRILNPSGSILLGSIAPDSRISLTQSSRGWELVRDTNSRLSSVLIDSNSFLFASAFQAVSQNISLFNSSTISSPNINMLSSGFTRINSSTLNTANISGSNINIDAESLILDSGVIKADIISLIGSSSNIDINAREFVELSNQSEIVNLTSGRDAGFIRIRTENLLVTEGSQINSSTRDSGDGGQIEVTASNSIEINDSRAVENRTRRSGIFSISDRQATGSAGEISVETRHLSLQNGTIISAETRGSGDGGQVSITADSVELNGEGSSIAARSTTPDGRAGEVNIVARELISVNNGATVTVSNEQGQAGDLIISSERILLDRGTLQAVTGFASEGDTLGANIRISDVLLLFMRNGSLISAEAIENAESIGIDGSSFDNPNATINAGNISINTINDGQGFIIATLDENNDIFANAIRGEGGNINIRALALYNLIERDADLENRTNDIDASSDFGPSGTVDINDPTTDPSRSRTELPESVLDARNLIDRSCSADVGQGRNSFVVTGRGGLPPSPADIVRSDNAGLTDFGTVAATDSSNAVGTVPPTSGESIPAPPQIVEAETWYRDASGTAVLTARRLDRSAEFTVPVQTFCDRS